MGYNKESKEYFIELYTQKLAHELYLDFKYRKKENNTIERIYNTCINSGWILNEEEKELMIKDAIELANGKYGLKYSINEF